MQLVHESVTEDEIAKIVSRWTGIPVMKLSETERQKTLGLADILHKRVIGQRLQRLSSDLRQVSRILRDLSVLSSSLDLQVLVRQSLPSLLQRAYSTMRTTL